MTDGHDLEDSPRVPTDPDQLTIHRFVESLWLADTDTEPADPTLLGKLRRSMYFQGAAAVLSKLADDLDADAFRAVWASIERYRDDD